MSLQQWALPQMSKLLPLDEGSLKQIIDYTGTLGKDEAAEHLKNMLGDSPQALEFITSFNARRQGPSSSSTSQPRHGASSSTAQPEAPPKTQHKKKLKNDFNKLPPVRRPNDFGNTAGAYVKPQQDEYLHVQSKPTGSSNHQNTSLSASAGSADLSSVPTVIPGLQPPASSLPRGSSPKPAPKAAGRLISENIKSRDSSPSKGKTKINVTGGVPMHGQSEVLNDLDSAIRALEIQTNPSVAPTAADNKKRYCPCMAQRHPLLEAAPNCLNCGKIICVKEGLGPCTSCGSAILSQTEIQSMIRVLREERGEERQKSHNASHKRAEVSQTPRAFTTPKVGSSPATSAPTSDSETERLSAAKLHRDKLLAFQAQNARRTRIHDEAADFETPDAGTNMWASPAERALQLKRQQKILREQEWNARPDYDKRRMVASIDLVGGKVVRRMQAVERPPTPESDDEPPQEEYNSSVAATKSGGGAFSKNPLLGGGLVRPIAKVDESGKRKSSAKSKSTWRRVQDDNDDNEQWILDGGLMGASVGGMIEQSQEPEN